MLPEAVDDGGHVARDAGAHDARVDGADAHVLLAAGERARKEEQRVLAVRVAEQRARGGGRARRCREERLPHAAEHARDERVRHRREHDDARVAARRAQTRQQPAREHDRRDVVHAKVRLEALRRRRQRRQQHPGVVHEHVQGRRTLPGTPGGVARAAKARERAHNRRERRPHAREVREVRVHDCRGAARGVVAVQRRRKTLARSHVAHDQHEVRPRRRETPRDGHAHAARDAGQHRVLAAEVTRAATRRPRQAPSQEQPHDQQEKDDAKSNNKQSVHHPLGKKKKENQKSKAPMGIEPMTFCLQDRRTTTMLRRQNLKILLF